MKKDRFVVGSLSGMIGGIAALLIWSMPAKMLGLTDRIFYDYGMHLILFKPKYEFLDYLVGLIAHLGISGVHGIIFAGLIYFTSSRYLLIKGFLYGCIVWLVNLGAGTLFKIPMFTTIPASAALVTWVGSIVWGLTAGAVLGYLHNRVISREDKKFRKHFIISAPAMKKEISNRKVIYKSRKP